MGLGKTMQVLALLLVLKREAGRRAERTSLLVAPASLLANWAAEIERFAPSLTALVAHPSAMPAAELRALDRERLADVDLVITSYGSLAARARGSPKIAWRLVVLDEAQAIKNPRRQADARGQAARRARADRAHRHAGREPARRSVVDLRLPQPGPARLGKEFARFAKRLAARPHESVRRRCASSCGRTSCGG